MCEKAQLAIENCLQRSFGKWGALIGRKWWLVLILALVFLMPFAAGWAIANEFTDGQRAWSPRNSQTANDGDVIDGLPLTKSSFATFIYKATNDANVLTRTHFDQILNFHNHLLTYRNSQLKNTECLKAGTRCLYTVHPA